MIYELTDDQKRIADKYRTFAEEELAPRAVLLDGSPLESVNDLMRENLKYLASAGFLGLGHEKACSGSDAGWVTLAVAGEAVSSSCAATFLSAFASACLFGMPLRLFGSDEQKKKYLPGIIQGDLVGACVLPEQQAVLGARSIPIQAARTAGGWSLRGGKTMITNAPIADVFLVPAFMGSERGRGQETAVFLLDRNQTGFDVSAPLDKMGYRGSPTADLVFEDRAIPGSSLLGEAGESLMPMERVLDFGRIGMAVASLGVAARCLEESRRYAMNKTSDGSPIGRHQEVAFKLADMVILTDLARLLLYKACWAVDRNGPESSVMASCAKVFAAEAASQAANLTMQISGGEGYIKTSAVERLYRDAKLGEICWGTSEMQRLFIGKEVLSVEPG